MRSVSQTLEDAQKSDSRTPYMKLVFTSKDGNTTYDFSTDSSAYGDRIKLIDGNDEPYWEDCTIILQNHDRVVPQMKGYWVEIGWGDTTSAGNEYVGDGTNEPATPRLWIKHQQDVSIQGKVVTVLELEGMWAKAREILVRIGNPPYYRDENGTYESITPYVAMQNVLTELGMTLNTLVEDDSIVNTYSMPILRLNLEPFESHGEVLSRLIRMTKSYLKPLDNLEWEIKYPQSSDSVDASYYSHQAPYFYEYEERYNAVIPNHIIVFCNEGENGEWVLADIITGEAQDDDEIDALYEVIRLVTAGEITNQSDATTRAEALLTRVQQEELGGKLLAPMDCRIELYDKIAVFDGR